MELLQYTATLPAEGAKGAVGGGGGAVWAWGCERQREGEAGGVGVPRGGTVPEAYAAGTRGARDPRAGA